MPHEDNPFLVYLNSHPGSDAVALKQLFRMLAKRSHPDLGAENEAAFVRLQEAYHEAVALLIRREEGARTEVNDHARFRSEDDASQARTTVKDGESEIWLPSSPRERVLHFLYRYKAHLPRMTLQPGPVPQACLRAFANAVEASASYTDECRYALRQFDDQFHANRRAIAKFPEVSTKYQVLIQGLASFFDYCIFTNRTNERLTRSFLEEIKPVTDFDPRAAPEVRSNRSAAARSAMYRMRTWLEAEVAAGPCRVL